MNSPGQKGQDFILVGLTDLMLRFEKLNEVGATSFSKRSNHALGIPVKPKAETKSPRHVSLGHPLHCPFKKCNIGDQNKSQGPMSIALCPQDHLPTVSEIRVWRPHGHPGLTGRVLRAAEGHGHLHPGL